MALSRDELKAVRQRKYISKDFDGLRSQLLDYARQYYPNQIKDFSESSMGGLLLDFASYVGDVMSFYLDHQFNELDPETAVEDVNIEKALNSAGVPIVGSAPSIVDETIYLEIPSSVTNNTVGLAVNALPVIQANSVFTSKSGIDFTLLEDVDFTKCDQNGELVVLSSKKVGKTTPTGDVLSYLVAMSGECISGKEVTETFSIGTDFIPFRTITLSSANITDITSVVDGYGNKYYRVQDLTNDVVYQSVINASMDASIVPDAIKVVPAPYRYTLNTDLTTRKSTLTFGGGNAESLDDDIIPDPSTFALQLPYTKTFSRIAVNPEHMLAPNTLGVATTNTTLTITYRYGGGLDNNVAAGTINDVKTLRIYFPNNPSPSVANSVKNSIDVSNEKAASGGEDAPTVDDLRSLIPTIKNSQERIVTRQDLIARVYTMPSNLGRVFRTTVHSNSNNPLATTLYVVSRNADGQLETSPDTLKQNLVAYLNPYRMISDAIDILDANIVNFKVEFDVLLDPKYNRNIVIQKILTKLQDTFDIKNFHIDQPIVISDIRNSIYIIDGVVTVNNIKFTSLTGLIDNRQYSSTYLDFSSATRYDMIFPPIGGIFEMRYAEYDIVGSTSV